MALALAGASGGCTTAGTAHSTGAARPPSSSAQAGTGPGATGTTAEGDDLGGPGAPTVAGGVVVAGQGSASGPAACRSGPPLANVYHPDRLSVVKACLTVGGTVESVRSETDGDVHFDLALDPASRGLLEPANLSAQHGWLVAEIVPADEPGCTPGRPPRPATGSYDYGLCTGADETAPAVGSHVYVTGPYVLDEDHGGWAEIHPVWALSGSPPSAPSPAAAPSTAAPQTTVAAAPAGVRVESVTSPVVRGSEASLVAQASPGAACDLEVTLPSGAPSRSEGLGPATADGSGRVAWSWRTGTRTKPGTATATVRCGTASAAARFDITA